MWERTVRCVFRGITERMRSERECVRFGSNNDNTKNNGRVEEMKLIEEEQSIREEKLKITQEKETHGGGEGGNLE